MNIAYQTAVNAGTSERAPTLSERLGRAVIRIRFQLLGGIIAAVIIPTFLRHSYQAFPVAEITSDNTLFGTLCALLLGFMIFRKVGALPGASAITNVFPAYLTSYTVIIAIFFMLRLDYSRLQFLTSFILVLVWYYAMSFAIARFKRPKFGLVADDSILDLQLIRGVDWRVMDTPEAASRYPDMPLVANFRSSTLSDEWERYLAEEAIAGRLVFNSRQIVESMAGRVRIENLSENSLGHLAPDSFYAPAKRYVDVIVSALGLIILSPFLLLTALAIKLDSRGPILFKQTRMGYRGKPFTVFKFRSMRPLQEAASADTDMTQNDDDRITRVGRFIRRTRIDELPQLWNVLCGEMSLIGPRPETLNLSSWYESEIPFYRYRHIVRPGITGWAQIKQGHVTSVDDVRRKLEYDFYYVKHFSLWTDILITIQTIRVMISGHGAK